MTAGDLVRWHDLECGGYDEDVALWRMLAAEAGGPVLDVGAGTGRIALDLAAQGHEVVAFDLEPALLDALRDRAAARGLAVDTVAGDATALDVGDRQFALVIVPMQTLQLLGGPDGRRTFLARARDVLRPGGVFAAALADALDAFDAEHTEPPLPDMGEFEGTVYASRPIAVRDLGPGGVVIERIRETVDPAGRRTAEGNAITLDRVSAEEVVEELVALGMTAEPVLRVPQTTEYVGSTVAVARRA